MGVTTEEFKEFIGDKRYAGVREYLLSAFKCVDKLTDLIINDPKCPYGNYEEHPWLNDTIEDISEPVTRCIELLERAYVD